MVRPKCRVQRPVADGMKADIFVLFVANEEHSCRSRSTGECRQVAVSKPPRLRLFGPDDILVDTMWMRRQKCRFSPAPRGLAGRGKSPHGLRGTEQGGHRDTEPQRFFLFLCVSVT